MSEAPTMYTTEYTRRTGGADWIPYWAAARQRELRFQRCVDCRRWRHPPGPLCPACGSARSAWEQRASRSSWSQPKPHSVSSQSLTRS